MSRGEPEDFGSFEEAFDACRDRDRPMLVRVGAEQGTVFPSGLFRPSPLTIRNLAGEAVPVPMLEDYLRQPATPFTAVPAFGSSEAVEQAAETIRGFTPGPWEVRSQADDPNPEPAVMAGNYYIAT